MITQDAIRRAIRTFLHAATTTIVVCLGSLTVVPDMVTLRSVLMLAVFSGVMALVSLIHNATEDNGTVPPLLKG